MDPVLASKVYRVNNAWAKQERIKVKGGLHYIRGNYAPYFSLTADIDEERRNGQWVEAGGGACYDRILKHFPQFADLAALHLSNIDGEPMHAESNALYWLAGAAGGLGEKYHGGSGSSAKSPEECLSIFAKHLRISAERAAELAESARASYAAALDAWSADMQISAEQGGEPCQLQPPRNLNSGVRNMLKALCNELRPEWKRQAEECIKHHGLIVYGDNWKRGL